RVTAASSRKTPAPWVAQSLTYVIETSTCLPAYGVRSIRHCCQPPELPEAAFQEPEAPVGSQFGPWYRWVNGWMLLQPDWQLLPVSWLVWPFASGSVVQSSPPAVRASTMRKSQSASVSYDVQKVSSPLDRPVRSIVLVSRFQATSEMPL